MDSHSRKKMLEIVIVVLVATVSLSLADGTAVLMDPPQRSSLWRYGYSTATNTDDGALNCGGYDNQWVVNAGKCGICGDPYQGPRLHEAGQLYASGIVVRNYTRNENGTKIPVSVNINKNTLGYFQFQLCADISTEDESCFQNNLIVDETGKEYFYPGSLGGTFNLYVIVPGGVNCSNCILRWQYSTGYRSEGDCLGCGNQETYYNCADIGIINSDQISGTDSSEETPSRVIFGTATNTNNEVEVADPENGTIVTLDGGIQVAVSETTTSPPGPVTVPDGMICYFPTSPAPPTTTTPDACSPFSASFQCVGQGHYRFIQGMRTWCLDNCRKGNCNKHVCSCSCGSTAVSNGQATSPELSCRSIRTGTTDAWCRNNCKVGICPSMMCSSQCFALFRASN